MPLPQIAIEIAAPESAMASSSRSDGAEARRILVASCRRAAATAECAIARPDAEAAVLALVFWRGAGHVRIEVDLAGRAVPWAIRELAFSPRDPALEKWRTVGYTVGSLASEALAAQEHPETVTPGTGESRGGSSGQTPGGSERSAAPDGSESHAAAATEGAPPEPATKSETAPTEHRPDAAELEEPKNVETEARDHGVAPRAIAAGPGAHRWSVDAGGLIGPGLASVRGGAFVRGSRVFRGPFATGALAYSVDVEDDRGVSARRVALSAGGGYELGLGRRFALDVRAELVAENLAARVQDAASGRSDGKDRWTAAVDVGAEVVTAIADPVGVVIGVDATLRTNRTDVQVGKSIFATAPLADVFALAGVRVVFR